jgi:hypothetical protein
MKILHVLETLSHRYGGPVSVLLALAAAQHRAGHQVTVVSKLNHPCLTSMVHNGTHSSWTREK